MSVPSVPSWPTAPQAWATPTAPAWPQAPQAWPQAQPPQAAWPSAPAAPAWPTAYAPSSASPWPTSSAGSRLDGSTAGPSVAANLQALGGTLMDSLRQLWGQLMQAFKA